jgi:hypothetical protein
MYGYGTGIHAQSAVRRPLMVATIAHPSFGERPRDSPGLGPLIPGHMRDDWRGVFQVAMLTGAVNIAVFAAF